MTVLRSTTFQLHVKNEDGTTKMRTFTRAVSDADETVKKLNEELGDNVTVTTEVKRSTQELTQQARLQISAMEKANKTYTAQVEILQHQINLLDKSGEEQAVLNAQQRLGSNATEEQRAEVARLAQEYYRLQQAQNGTSGSLRDLRGVAQNFGWQMQDTIVQLQMGTDGFIVLSQQGSQMAAAFGATGAIIGAVIALVGAAMPTIIKMLDETATSTKDLEAAQKSLDDIFDKSKYTINGYTDELRQLYEIDQQLAELKIMNAVLDAEKLIKANAESVRELTAEFRDLGEGFRVINSREQEYAEDLEDLAKKFGLTTEEVKKLGVASNQIGPNGDLGAISQLVKEIARDNPNVTESFKALALSIGNAGFESGLTKEQLEQLNEVINDGLPASTEYSNQIGELAASFNNKLKALDQTEREQALYNARVKAGLDISGEELKTVEKSINAYYDRKEAIDAAEESAKKRKEAEEKERKELEKLERALNKVIKKSGEFTKQTDVYTSGMDTLDEALKKGLISQTEFTDISEALFEEYFDNVGGMFEEVDRVSTDFAANMESLFAAMEGGNATNVLMYTNALMTQMGVMSQMSGMMNTTLDTIFNGTDQVKAAIDEMNGLQQAAFFVTQTIAAAEAVINGITLGSKLAAMFPTAAPAMLTFGASVGAAQAGAIMGTTFAGFFDEGGHIPAGQSGIVSEYGDELVNGVMVRGPADVTSRVDTAAMTGGTNMYVDVQNYAPGVKVSQEKLSENRIRLIIREEMAAGGDDMVSNALSKPGSKSQRSVTSNFQTAKRYS